MPRDILAGRASLRSPTPSPSRWLHLVALPAVLIRSAAQPQSILASMVTGSNDETPTNAPQPLAADDDERSELLFESASEDEAAAATAAETPPREAVADIPNNLRDTLKSGRRDTAPARVTSTKRARKATSRFADLEAKGQTYSQSVENDDDEVASPPRPPPTRFAPPRPPPTRPAPPQPPQPRPAGQDEAPSDLPSVSQGHGDRCRHVLQGVRCWQVQRA